MDLVEFIYRAKLVPEGSPMSDFHIQKDDGFIDLLGIESPGLTSSLAIGDYVAEMIF